MNKNIRQYLVSWYNRFSFHSMLSSMSVGTKVNKKVWRIACRIRKLHMNQEYILNIVFVCFADFILVSETNLKWYLYIHGNNNNQNNNLITCWQSVFWCAFYTIIQHFKWKEFQSHQSTYCLQLLAAGGSWTSIIFEIANTLKSFGAEASFITTCFWSVAHIPMKESSKNYTILLLVSGFHTWQLMFPCTISSANWCQLLLGDFSPLSRVFLSCDSI